ncbi:response regulator [bacterium]|nr:response regulator [bacterium]
MVEKKKVVVIDDEEDVLTYLTTALVDNDYEVQSAKDTDKGVEIIRTFKPDLICLDILMPGRTGISLYKEIKMDENFKNIPILIISGLKREELFNDNGNGDLDFLDNYIEKPVKPEKFIELIRKMINCN